MPNNETNTVVIIGPPDNIQRFVTEALADGEGDQPPKVIDFNLIVPQPEDLSNDPCGHLGLEGHAAGSLCWYAWNPEHWGTKWNAYTHSHYELRHFQEYGNDETYARVDLRFETAWSQPTPVLRVIEERWGVKVHAVTQDEGGADDVEYGDPYEAEVIERRVEHIFTTWDKEIQL